MGLFTLLACHHSPTQPKAQLTKADKKKACCNGSFPSRFGAIMKTQDTSLMKQDTLR